MLIKKTLWHISHSDFDVMSSESGINIIFFLPDDYFCMVSWSNCTVSV